MAIILYRVLGASDVFPPESVPILGAFTWFVREGLLGRQTLGVFGCVSRRAHGPVVLLRILFLSSAPIRPNFRDCA